MIVIERIAGSGGLTGNLAPGMRIASFEYAGTSSIVRQSLANGIQSRFVYDDATRLSRLDHEHGGIVLSRTRYVHDADGRRCLAWNATLPQSPSRLDYDHFGHMTGAVHELTFGEPSDSPAQAAADALIAAAAPLTSTKDEQFTVDVAAARTAARIDRGANSATETYTVDNASRVVNLSRVGASPGSWDFVYDGDGRCTTDDRHQYAYDPGSNTGRTGRW